MRLQFPGTAVAIQMISYQHSLSCRAEDCLLRPQGTSMKQASCQSAGTGASHPDKVPAHSETCLPAETHSSCNSVAHPGGLKGSVNSNPNMFSP